MTNEEIAIQLQKTEDRSVRNEGRIKKLEAEHEALHSLATSVAVMAEKQGNISDKVDAIDNKVTDMESKSGKRWDNLVDKTIWLIAGGFIAYILAQIGL